MREEVAKQSPAAQDVLQELVNGIHGWVQLIIGGMSIYWLFAGLPEWVLFAGFIYGIDGHWFLRLLFICIGMPIVALLIGAIITLPVAAIGTFWTMRR
jgi:hypothetical protein